MKDKYVLDSSVWIEMQRGNTAVLSIVQPFIENNQICLVDVIAAEVLRGVRTLAEFKKLKLAFDDFPLFSTSWERVAELAFTIGRKGFQPPLIDLYIAQSVVENDKVLVTKDKHFQQIAKFQPIKIMMI